MVQIISLFIVAKFLHLQSRCWQERDSKSYYTKSIFVVWSESIASHMKKILIIIIITTGLQILKQTECYLIDTKQSYVLTEATCILLIYSCTHVQASSVSNELHSWSPTDDMKKENDLKSHVEQVGEFMSCM